MAGDSSDELRIDIVAQNAADWLLAQQDEQTGGWGQQHGQDPNSLNTAEAMLALLSCDCGVIAAHEPIQRAKRFLLRHQDPESGAWTRQVKHDHEVLEIKDVLRTSVAVQALLRCGVGSSEEPINMAVRWLARIDVQGDEGWGYDSEDSSRFLPTCFAVTALTDVASAKPKPERQAFFEQFIRRGKDYILAARNRDGSFDTAGPLQAAHTLHAVLVLQKLRFGGFDCPADAEAQALEWLRLNPNAALAAIEEEIVLDSELPQHNYPFLFMTDALLVSAYFSALAVDERRSELARRALYEVRLRWVPSGGFLGNRPFSWSTAKCMLALRDVARQHVETFPTLDPEPEPDRIRSPDLPAPTTFRAALGFTVLLLFGAMVLALTDRFSSLIGAFLVFLALSSLLITGRISERTFSALASVRTSAGSAPSEGVESM